MKSTSLWAQLALPLCGYAAVLVVAAMLLFGRHLQELRYPADASGGMWAAGDAFLYIFIACLFMVPTTFLLFVIARFETFYQAYSKVLLGLSLSAPICGGIFFFGENRLTQTFSILCVSRLVLSPFILGGMGVSRLVARFDRAKRLISYAFLIESLTFSAAVALALFAQR